MWLCSRGLCSIVALATNTWNASQCLLTLYIGGHWEHLSQFYAGGQCLHRILQRQAHDLGVCDHPINEEATWLSQLL